MLKLLSFLFVTLSISFAAHAKEAVAFVTHKVILNDKGEVSSVVPVKSEIVVPEGSKMSAKEHQDHLTKAVDLHMKKPETLFSFKDAFNTAKEKTVQVVSSPLFKKTAEAAGSVAIAVGTIYAAKKINEKISDAMNPEEKTKNEDKN